MAWQANVNQANPDLLVVAPSFENCLEQYALDTSEYVYNLCMSRLQKGKHILILDAG